LGFSVAAIGSFAATVAVFFVLPAMPQNPLIQITAVFVLFAIAVFPAFGFDRLAWRRRKTFDSQRKTGQKS